MDQAAMDARMLCKGKYSAWLNKVKSEGTRSKWLCSTNKRYFTIDFEAKVVFYSHSTGQKKVSQPIKFKEILGAERLPPNKKRKGCGFVFNTMGKALELYTATNPDAVQWVHALNAARDAANDKPEAADTTQNATSINDLPDRCHSDCYLKEEVRVNDGAASDFHHSQTSTATSSEKASAEKEGINAYPQPQRRHVNPKPLPLATTTAPVAVAKGSAHNCASNEQQRFPTRDAAIRIQASAAEEQETAQEVMACMDTECSVAEEAAEATCGAKSPRVACSKRHSPTEADAVEAGLMASETTHAEEKHSPARGELRAASKNSSEETRIGEPTTVVKVERSAVVEVEEMSAIIVVDMGTKAGKRPATRSLKPAPVGISHDSQPQPLPRQPWRANEQKAVDFYLASSGEEKPLLAPSDDVADTSSNFLHKARSDCDEASFDDEAKVPVTDSTDGKMNDSLDFSLLTSDSQGPTTGIRAESPVAKGHAQSGIGWTADDLGFSDDEELSEGSPRAAAIRPSEPEHQLSIKQEEASGWDSDDDTVAQTRTAFQQKVSKQTWQLQVHSPSGEGEPGDCSGQSCASASPESGSATSRLRRSRVSFKETPELIQVVVNEHEHSGWDAGGETGLDGPLPADMSALLRECMDDEDDDEEDPDDWDTPEAEPVTLNEKSTEPSGWDSDDGDEEAGQSPEKEDGQDTSSGLGQQTGAAPASNVPAISATGQLDPLDDLLGAILGGGDSTSSVPSRSSAPFRGSDSYGFVPNLHCIGCDFQVLRIENYSWSKESGYMFFRNNYPNVMRLRKNLTPQAESCAYCCQCSWKSTDSKVSTSDVAQGLRWKIISGA